MLLDELSDTVEKPFEKWFLLEIFMVMDSCPNTLSAFVEVGTGLLDFCIRISRKTYLPVRMTEDS